jgi:hypothetical protein
MRWSRVSSAWWGVGAGLLVSAACFIHRIVISTFRYQAWLHHRMTGSWDTPWDRPYPTASVVRYSALIVVEALVLWIALMKLASPTLSMHSPPAGGYHELWLLSITATMIVTALVAGIVHFVRSR